MIKALAKYFWLNAAILILMALSSGCNKVSEAPTPGIPLRVYNLDPNAGFNGISSDKNGNIYTMENKSDSDSVLIRKVSPGGNPVWQKGLAYPQMHISGFIIHDIGDGLLLIIDTGRSGQYSSRFILESKMDYDGNVLWTKTLPFYQISNISVGPDHDYMLYGTWLDSKYNFFLPYAVKSDLNGKIFWQKEFSQFPWDAQFDNTTSSGFFTSDDGFAFYGNSPNPFNHVLITRIDPAGNVMWHDTIGPSDCQPAFNFTGSIGACTSTGACETADGHLVFGIGASAKFGQATYMFAAVCDKNGNDMRVKNLNLPIENNGGGISGANFGMTPDNGFYVGTSTTIKGIVSKNNLIIAKYDAGFNPKFTKTYGGYYDLNSGTVIPYSNGGFLMGMTTPAFGKGANGIQITFMVVDENGNQ